MENNLFKFTIFASSNTKLYFMSKFNEIRQWATNRGLYSAGNSKSQLLKLSEEIGELNKAELHANQEEIIDAIGDIVVVLTNYAHLKGLKIEDCIDHAYNIIKNRKGKMINGTFVKK